MSDLYVKAQQNSVGRTSDGNWVALRSTRDGAPITLPWFQALAMDGECFGVGYGATALGFSDPATFGVGTAGTAINTEIDYLQTVPLNTTVIPLYINVIAEALGTILQYDIVYFWGGSGIIGASSVAITPHNLRSDDSNTSACTVATFGDAGGTAFVPAGQIFRKGGRLITMTATTPGWDQSWEWSVADKGIAPIIVGAASPASQIGGWSSLQAGTGFSQVQWAEIDSSTIT